MGSCSTKLNVSPDWELQIGIQKSKGNHQDVSKELLDKAVNIKSYDKPSQQAIKHQLHQFLNIDVKIPPASIPNNGDDILPELQRKTRIEECDQGNH
jgi:hypothetical protein